MDAILQALLSGILLGGFYAVMVLGFSIIWGVMGVINLAHGEYLMIGAYLAWIFSTYLGMDPFFSLILIMPIMFVVGYVVQLVDFAGLTFPLAKSFMFIASIIIMIVLTIFLQRSRLGKSIRAAAQNKNAARIVGIEINQVYAMTAGICIALTAHSGRAHRWIDFRHCRSDDRSLCAWHWYKPWCCHQLCVVGNRTNCATAGYSARSAPTG